MRVIYVDDEIQALHNFRLTVAALKEITSLQVFQHGSEAIDYVRAHPVDVAFLDMEMQGELGLDVARKMQEIKPELWVVFITAYSHYALEAFSVDAIGYILKPYLKSDIQKALAKVARYATPTEKRVVIQTIPSFAVTIDQVPFGTGRDKTMELFALLVENGDHGITTSEGISYLWPDRPNDNATSSLFRMTYKRLFDALDKVDAADILVSENNRRYVKRSKVDCDLYRILDGDKELLKRYDGRYLQEYSWAEERNGQLLRMALGDLF